MADDALVDPPRSGSPLVDPPLIRPALTRDVLAIARLVDAYSGPGQLLARSLVTLYEDVPEFIVADHGGEVIGCGALHVMWEDLAEVRSLAVRPAAQSRGVGSTLLEALLARARTLGVTRVFCLTFQTRFFGRHGFTEIDAAPVTEAVYQQMLQSFDDGVAEFLELERVKANTLGNTRMLRHLT